MTLSFEVTLTEQQVEQLAERVAVLLDRTPDTGPVWLDTAGAADYLAAPRSRIHDLVALGRLHPHRDGRRLVFRRDDLDRYLTGGPDE